MRSEYHLHAPDLEDAMIELFCHPDSGHAHRVELMLSLPGLDYRRHVTELGGSELRSPEYLRLNPER